MEVPMLLTPEQAARRLNISRAQLYKLLAMGDIPCISFGKSRRILPTDLDVFIAKKREEPFDQAVEVQRQRRRFQRRAANG